MRNGSGCTRASFGTERCRRSRAGRPVESPPFDPPRPVHRHLVRDILRLAWPVYIAQIAIMANGVVDTVMAGHYGTVDLAAVGIGASVYVTLFVTLMGVLFAITPTVAQLHGAGRYAEIGEEVRQSGWLAAGL